MVSSAAPASFERAVAGMPEITVSVISHSQGALVLPLLRQLSALARTLPLRVIVTENLPGTSGALAPPVEGEPTQRLYDKLISNPEPKGFGANHNAAFAHSATPYFCVINPDIRLVDEPFSRLCEVLRLVPGIAAPCVMSSSGGLEDSARRVPTFSRLWRRTVAGERVADYVPDGGVAAVDWVAGMLMMFDADAFRRLGGFDDRFHLYCEDVDICLRAHLAGFSVQWVTDVSVQHDAQRDSRRKWKYLAWHVESMARLFLSPSYFAFLRRRQRAG
ncbi:glycosyltransferase family 2 protein [Cupriavidus oxalaticus]|uniref:glycosyltransferase family 2 protein n=1 Tax=Cupriavidus oxalaticus TaxID=96344 RepID=UPI0040346427